LVTGVVLFAALIYAIKGNFENEWAPCSTPFDR